MEHVYGVTSVAAALMAGRRSLLRLVLADSAFKPGKSPPLMMRRLQNYSAYQVMYLICLRTSSSMCGTLDVLTLHHLCATNHTVIHAAVLFTYADVMNIVVVSTKKKMSETTKGRPHQGVVLECSPLPTIPAPLFGNIGNDRPLWVAADKVRCKRVRSLCTVRVHYGLA